MVTRQVEGLDLAFYRATDASAQDASRSALVKLIGVSVSVSRDTPLPVAPVAPRPVPPLPYCLQTVINTSCWRMSSVLVYNTCIYYVLVCSRIHVYTTC